MDSQNKKQETNSGKPLAEPIFRINGCFYGENCLPSLNDMLSAATRHPQAYARMKREMEWAVIQSIRRDLKGWKAESPVRIDITFGEKNKGRKRDYDNIVASGRKIINDALVKSGVIKDDHPSYLLYGNNDFEYTDKPYIEVKIIEVI